MVGSIAQTGPRLAGWPVRDDALRPAAGTPPPALLLVGRAGAVVHVVPGRFALQPKLGPGREAAAHADGPGLSGADAAGSDDVDEMDVEQAVPRAATGYAPGGARAERLLEALGVVEHGEG